MTIENPIRITFEIRLNPSRASEEISHMLIKAALDGGDTARILSFNPFQPSDMSGRVAIQLMADCLASRMFHAGANEAREKRSIQFSSGEARMAICFECEELFEAQNTIVDYFQATGLNALFVVECSWLGGAKHATNMWNPTLQNPRMLGGAVVKFCSAIFEGFTADRPSTEQDCLIKISAGQLNRIDRSLPRMVGPAPGRRDECIWGAFALSLAQAMQGSHRDPVEASWLLDASGPVAAVDVSLMAGGTALPADKVAEAARLLLRDI